MAKTSFADDPKHYAPDTQQRRNWKRDYYLGECSIAASPSPVETRCQTVGSITIVHLKTEGRVTIRRSWPDIRRDASDLTVFWFVKRGRLAVSSQGSDKVVEPGAIMATRSTAPFVIECQPDPSSVHEVLHVTVPTHVLPGFLSDELASGCSAPPPRREFAIAEGMLTALSEDEGSLPSDTSKIIAKTALEVTGQGFRDCGFAGRCRKSVSDQRFEAILSYLEINLTNPNLSIAAIARGCGISIRYVQHLLGLRGTSYWSLVWNRRLERAKELLASPNNTSIRRIGYDVGFKTPAHFSRVFKQTYGMSPTEYRAANVSTPGGLEASVARRLESAKALLSSSKDASIGSIGHDVGFERLSHFSQLFKRTYGMTPSAYRAASLGASGVGEPGLARE